MVRQAHSNTSKKRVRNPEPVSRFPASSSEYIKTITSLKRRPQTEHALELLHKIASIVKPIMKNYGFKVTTLCEFYPKNKSLLGLNVNHGLKICIRLRQPYDESQFYPMESLIGTMLHELTHNKYGPHDNKFYAFLKKITGEMEDLIAKGYSGEGFYSKGHTLGGVNVDPAVARDKRANVLEQRAGMFAGSGQKLGGPSASGSGANLRDLVRQAAEKRANDAKWCASDRPLSREDLGDDDSEIEEIGATEFVEVVKLVSRSGSPDGSLDEPGAKRVKKEPNVDDIVDLTSD